VVVGFIGSLKRWHGVELLLQGAAAVASRNIAVRFLIAGDGPLRAAPQAAAEQAGLGERACFAGYVTRDEAPGYIAAMDIAVAPYPRLQRLTSRP
jgi:glycosyltransferase involved in cell wall biosynthesis